jgi:hypothetical protein
MEQVLGVYAAIYDPLYPVVCFDERPCFLIGDTVEGLEMKPNQPKRENYAYSKHGSASVLAAIEPLTGKRLAHVRRQRNKIAFAKFMKQLSDLYPNAIKIRVVLDNLNTHNSSSFYEVFDAQTAANLADRFDFVYTPKSASWLNMIEIEFSVLSRQCLNCRIPSINQLTKQVFAFFKERNEKKVKINWAFDRKKARIKLKRHYSNVNQANQ